MRFVLAWVAVVAGCSNHDAPPSPSPPPTPPTPPPRVAPPIDAAVPAPPSGSWMLVRLSSDGTRALLSDITPSTPTSSPPLRYRVVEVDTNKVLGDTSFPALSDLPPETLLDSGKERTDVKVKLDDPQLTTELRALGTILAGFPLGSASDDAAAPGGSPAVFSAGDWLYTVKDGRIGSRLAREASYAPWILPDGKTVLFSRMNGTFDGVIGRYELYAASLDSRTPAPRRLDGTAGVRHDWFALTPDGLRVYVSNWPQVRTCMIEVAFAGPHKVKKLGCIPGNDETNSCVGSPHGRFLACNMVRETNEDDPNTVFHEGSQQHFGKKRRHFVRVLDVDSGQLTYDQERLGMVSAINDAGTLVLSMAGQTLVVDGTGEKALPEDVTLFPIFRTDRELVGEKDGSVRVLKL